MSITLTRTLATTLAASAVGVVAAAVLPTQPAQATSYVYWSYWHGTSTSSSWTYSPVGAASFTVFDGDVEGWRFAASADSSAGVRPRATPSDAFAKACGSVTADAGEIRVAVVVDQGVAADRPAHSVSPEQPFAVCKVLSSSTRSTGLDAIAARPAQSVRFGSGSKVGFVCGIDGYPSVGCGGIVSDPTPKPTASQSATGRPSSRQSPSSTTSSAESTNEASNRITTEPGASASVTSPQSPTASSSSATTRSAPSTSESPVPLAIGDPGTPTSTSGGGSTGAVAGILAIALVAGAAAVVAVRRLR